ncbi:hypothetical protein [Conexibacter woesei]|uniref:hypothetical protein n=1 Tax=Conexibacter woesei TaxID=191495 RepID=UPI0004184228|nr:hypothetical protein [Conexibacter woesei]
MPAQDDDAIDALYAGAFEDFVPARDALVKELRAARQRDEAAAVRKLAKPSRAAWAVNRLVRSHPDEVEALVEAGETLAASQEQLLEGADPAVLRAAAEAARALVDALAGQAEADGPTRDKVRATLHAATVDPEVRAAVRSGRLTREASASGFGGLEALIASGHGQAAAPSRKRPAAKRKARGRRAPEEKPPPGPDPREVRRLRDALRRANEAEADAESEVDGARRALEQVEATITARRRDLEDAETTLAAARTRRERAEAAAAALDASQN